jgi:ATP-dependent Lhr-like helicase
VRGYKREWLDQVTLSGEVAWGRLWGAGASPVRRTPLCLVRREDLESWTSLAGPPPAEPGGTARDVYLALLEKGAMFFQELARTTKLPPAYLETALADLIGQGRVTCDSFGGLRWMLIPAWRRKVAGAAAGRWSVLRRETGAAPAPDFMARQLLRRTGVIFRRTLTREKQPIPWRDIARACRALEARGDIRGGRFVAGFDGEQYALPEAVPLLREVRKRGERPLGSPPLSVAAADPLNFVGILTPDDRVASSTRQQVRVG